MDQNNQQDSGNFTVAGTDIDEVKKLNANSGMSYNEVKEWLAKTGGKNTSVYSDTDTETVKIENQRRLKKKE
ncbi:gamma-type small acid-soluble spore protein [Oceanobacillus senegalensis]|uniref:gamma-type small acid-soluble spore protein n=1 Tax=Oceanobacillus senegalensis TaxID=1936063 RepID=UPI000A3139C4|nr:gamma-type small acid-soluble spore protein [Oceanobacillus senegalensis]